MIEAVRTGCFSKRKPLYSNGCILAGKYPSPAATFPRVGFAVGFSMRLRKKHFGKVLPGAGDGIRTRDINLGKVALYQLSYSRSTAASHIL